MKQDAIRCYGCRQAVAEKDVWWLQIPNGGKVTVCGGCWSAAHALQPIGFSDWRQRQRAFSRSASGGDR